MLFRSGMVVGVDTVPTARLMLVCPALSGIRLSESVSLNWWAVALRDDAEDGWETGAMVTINPVNPGIVLIEEAE